MRKNRKNMCRGFWHNLKLEAGVKKEKFETYIYWGVTAFVVLVLLVAVIFLLINWKSAQKMCTALLGILEPIIYGAVFAYLMAPIYNRVCQWTEKIFSLVKLEKAGKKLSTTVATLASLLVLVAVVTGLVSMLVPQVITSIRGVIEALPAGVLNLEMWLEQLFRDNPDVEAQVMQYYAKASTWLQNWLTNDLIPNIYNIATGVYSGIFTAVHTVLNMIIGLIVMVYLLSMKDKLKTQTIMVIYGALPVRVANKVIEEVRYVHKIFGGFIIGKLLDSLIIGILCYVLLSFMNMPYVLLVSVIVGVTNVVPFFGPFIGAVPSAFLILLASPIKCLYFIIFILLLQQFDGNILGPKILGDSTGLSSFWVLFSILLFGGVFGFVGMIIGVPTFAVFYKLMKELISWLLKRKNLSAQPGKYENLDHIDEEQKTYIQK